MPEQGGECSRLDEYGDPVPSGEPSPAEIDAKLEEIRGRWGRAEWRKRRAVPLERWTMPVCEGIAEPE